MALLYTNNRMAENEIVNTVPFKIAEKNRKYLGNKLTKDVENLYDENYKTFKNK